MKDAGEPVRHSMHPSLLTWCIPDENDARILTNNVASTVQARGRAAAARVSFLAARGVLNALLVRRKTQAHSKHGLVRRCLESDVTDAALPHRGWTDSRYQLFFDRMIAAAAASTA